MGGVTNIWHMFLAADNIGKIYPCGTLAFFSETDLCSALFENKDKFYSIVLDSFFFRADGIPCFVLRNLFQVGL